MRTDFLLSELVNGNIVENKRGNRYLYLNKSFMCKDNGFDSAYYLDRDLFNEDLTFKMSNQFDIVKVYRCKAKTLDTIFDDDKLTLIWERQ